MLRRRKKLALKSEAHRLGGVSLRPLANSDRDKICRWMTSSYILQHTFVVTAPDSAPYDFATNSYALRYFNLLMTEKRRITFAITLNGIAIGSTGLKNISFNELHAECFIEIGESKCRGQLFGTTAMSLLLDYGFYGFGLKKISLEVLEFNCPAIRMYHRLGFVSAGQSGWHYDEHGQYWHVLGMSLTDENWFLRSKT